MNFKDKVMQDKSKHGLHKFKFYYEDVKENIEVYRKVTRVDRAWDRAADISLSALSAAWYIFTKFRKVKQDA